MPLGMTVGLGPGHVIFNGDLAAIPKKKRGTAPAQIFGPCLLWPNGWIDQDTAWYGVGLGPGDIVLDGNPAPRPASKGHPQFSANVCCSQPTGWIKMSLGMEVALRAGDIVLDGGLSSP